MAILFRLRRKGAGGFIGGIVRKQFSFSVVKAGRHHVPLHPESEKDVFGITGFSNLSAKRAVFGGDLGQRR